MKKTLFLLLIIGLTVGCGKEEKKPPVKPAAALRTNQSAATAEFVSRNIPPAVIQQGQNASKKLLETLKSQLIAAMRQNGVTGALSFCTANAQKLTNDVNVSYQGTVNIKRISLKYRNPKDKPDKFEDLALHLMQKTMAGSGTAPDHLIQKITKNGTVKYRFYKPLVIGMACLPCHGDKKKIKPGILKTIREHYPKGDATGYKKGQLRGAVRVEMNAPAPQTGM